MGRRSVHGSDLVAGGGTTMDRLTGPTARAAELLLAATEASMADLQVCGLGSDLH